MMHCARVSSGPPRCAPGVVHACATYHAAASARRQRIMGGGVMPFLCAALPPLYNQSLICKLLLPSHLSRLIPSALDDLCCLRYMETQTGAHGRRAGRSSSPNLRFQASSTNLPHTASSTPSVHSPVALTGEAAGARAGRIGQVGPN